MSPNVNIEMTPRKWSRFLSKLHSDLNGHMNEVAAKAGVSSVTVHRVLTGKTYNSAVLHEAVKYRNEILTIRHEEMMKLIKLSNEPE